MLTASLSTSVRRIDNALGLRQLAEPWETLAGDVPFLRPTWMAAWWRHYSQPADQLYVLVVERGDGQVIGIAPWYVSQSSRYGRVLRFLGSGEVCSDYLTILTASDDRSQVVSALAEWLADTAKDWDLIELIGVEAGDATVLEFARRMQGDDLQIHTRPGLNTWRLSLPGTWDEYVKTLSKSRRERVRQLLRRKFEPGHAGTALVQSPVDLQADFETFVDLHQRRRQSLGEPGCFTSPRFAAFHREMSKSLLAEGKLRLCITRLDGRAIHAEYDISGGDTVYYYQSGIEPELAAERPGWLGAIGALRMCIEHGYRHFDFLRGDEPYKSSWGATAVPATEFRIVGSSASARLRHVAWRAATGAKHWIRERIRTPASQTTDG